MARHRRSQWNDWRSDRYFTPSRPIRADGGIKSKSQRGEFGASWWAKRWIKVLEGFNIGGGWPGGGRTRGAARCCRSRSRRAG